MTEQQNLLIVDDDQAVVDYLCDTLGSMGYRVQGVTSGTDALLVLERSPVDLVISDIEMPGMRGTELMAAIHRKNPGQLVLLITAFGSIDLAVKCVRAGASDFVTKPFRIEVLQLAIERALKERQMRREIVRLRSSMPGAEAGGIVARSHAMRKVVSLGHRASQVDATVLITGESGTGKGMLARMIHTNGSRADAPFIEVNCAAIPPALVESELFGVRKGAFTDAKESRPGLFQQAHKGTLFLDEVAEMPLETQAKLLHVLENRRVRAVGGTEDSVVDVRIIAATNRSLEESMNKGHFRSDLYYRLNILRIEIPPLRERTEDIEPMIDAFLQRANSRYGRSVLGISTEAMRWLLSHPWPGNARELANAIERAVALTEHDSVLLEDLQVSSADSGTADDSLRHAAAQGLTLADVELRYIQAVLKQIDGNKSKAASLLGIDRRTLYRRLEAEGLLEDS